MLLLLSQDYSCADRVIRGRSFNFERRTSVFRVIFRGCCPHCRAKLRNDYTNESICYVHDPDRPMGPECGYDVDTDDFCSRCGELLHVAGTVYEYPEGCEALNELKVK